MNEKQKKPIYPLITKPFKWTRNRQQAAEHLALGFTHEKTAELLDLSRDTVTRWNRHPEFRKAVDDMSLMCGIACKAERLRIAQRAVAQFVTEHGVKTEQDVLAWLKFAQSETDGIKINIATTIAEALAVAAGGSVGGSAEHRGGEDGGTTEA